MRENDEENIVVSAKPKEKINKDTSFSSSLLSSREISREINALEAA